MPSCGREGRHCQCPPSPLPTDAVSRAGQAQLLRGAGHPPRAGTASGLPGTVPLQLEGSSQKCPTTSGLLSPKNTPREAVESSRAGRQPRTPALSHSPLHQASHGRLRPQLLPGDARAEGHQIPSAAGEDPGEHPEQCQCPLSPAGSGSCHGPGQCQHQRAQTAQGSG